MRRAWGCDAQATRPVFDIGCNRCSGYNPDCELCTGTNRVDQYRCPNTSLREASVPDRTTVELLLRTYLHYDNRQVLPASGGLLDQTRGWLAACEIIDSERGRIEQAKQAARERDQKAAESRAKRGRR